MAIANIKDPTARAAAMQQFEASQQKPAAQSAAKPPASYAEISKMYPGVPEAKLREAFKKKFGVDLQ